MDRCIGRQFSASIVFALLCASLSSCDESEGEPAGTKDSGSSMGDASDDSPSEGRDAAATDSAAPDAARDAGMDARAGEPSSDRCDDLDQPFERTGERGLAVARFVSIEPAFLYNGHYNWMLELHTPSGDAIGDAEVKAKAFMRAHGHGTSPIMLRHEAGSSSYELNDVNLFMEGKWEVTVTVRASTGDDVIEFRACPIDPPDAGGEDEDAGGKRGGHR